MHNWAEYLLQWMQENWKHVYRLKYNCIIFEFGFIYPEFYYEGKKQIKRLKPPYSIYVLALRQLDYHKKHSKCYLKEEKTCVSVFHSRQMDWTRNTPSVIWRNEKLMCWIMFQIAAKSRLWNHRRWKRRRSRTSTK